MAHSELTSYQPLFRQKENQESVVIGINSSKKKEPPSKLSGLE
jgi:hypothetical protein